MPAKAPDTNVENAVNCYRAGESLEVTAARFHTSYKRLQQVLRDRGLLRTTAESEIVRLAKLAPLNQDRALDLPDSDIVAWYHSGDSTNSIAKRLGVSRRAVDRRLIRAGVTLRTVTEANGLSMRQRSPAVRAANIRAAQDAQRGGKHTIEQRMKVAQGRELRQSGVSAAELLLQVWLADLGVASIPQKAIGPYNADLAAGPVAVEIFGGGWHATGRAARRAPDRFRYILNQGWNVIIVWVDNGRYPLSLRAAEYIAAYVEESRRDPSLRGQYRVIWGDGQAVSIDRLNIDNLTLKPARR